MEIIPLNGYVLLEEIDDSGVIIPESVDREKSDRCKVVTGGQLVVAGELVLIRPHLFEDIKLDEKHYLIGKEENIIGRIK